MVGTGPAAVGRGRPFWDGRACGRLAGIPEQGERQLCQACEQHGRSFHEHSVAQVEEMQDSRILSAFQRGGHS